MFNLSSIYRKSIEHLSNIYRTSIEHLSEIYRNSIEHLSSIYRISIEHLSNIYRTSIERLSNIYRTSRSHRRIKNKIPNVASFIYMITPFNCNCRCVGPNWVASPGARAPKCSPQTSQGALPSRNARICPGKWHRRGALPPSTHEPTTPKVIKAPPPPSA